LFEFKLSGSGVTALCCNNDAPKGHYYLQKAVTSDQITQQNSLQGAGAPDFQANTKPRIFFKANVTARYRKTVVRNPVIVSLRQFNDNEA
jgi:hypothetical protein